MTKKVKTYNFSVDKFEQVKAYESEHGRWCKREDYAALEQECERLRDDLEKAHRATNSECQDWAREYERRKAVQAEREAALLQVEALRELLADWAAHFTGPKVIGGPLSTLRERTDAALKDKP